MNEELLSAINTLMQRLADLEGMYKDAESDLESERERIVELEAMLEEQDKQQNKLADEMDNMNIEAVETAGDAYEALIERRFDDAFHILKELVDGAEPVKCLGHFQP